ncbi:MAG: hypothetical protein HKN21_06945 [Candidatus Eisenbacteria bacterium]|uniref:Uncharacterized protein n=1 Tax=Eiseniibacteriota bacterium TaxID=2212470 RepID=A0A7Y2EAP6_UNCEI|nr:hypothetical protein [Candidatus Eisenbacteria bacterium]
MPAFSLYASGGVLWTETARLVREADDERAELHLERHAPEEAGEASLLVGPREPVDKNQLISVFGGLFK